MSAQLQPVSPHRPGSRCLPGVFPQPFVLYDLGDTEEGARNWEAPCACAFLLAKPSPDLPSSVPPLTFLHKHLPTHEPRRVTLFPSCLHHAEPYFHSVPLRMTDSPPPPDREAFWVLVQALSFIIILQELLARRMASECV